MFESRWTLRISFSLRSRNRLWEPLRHHSKSSLNPFSVKSRVERTPEYSPPSYTENSTSSINICSTVSAILPVLLYGCESWSLTLREERRMRVFENRVLRRILGPKRDEVTWEWRKLHIEEFNDPYSLPSIVLVIKSRRMR